MVRLPEGPGSPAPDGAQALAEATTICANLASMTAEIGAGGTAGGRRVRARILAGLAQPASARLEAFAFGQPIFVFTAHDGLATLLLTREARVLERGEPAAVLEALTGIPLDARDLRLTLAGCPLAPEPTASRAFGDVWRVFPDGDGSLYLRRDSGQWRVVARVGRTGEGSEWRAEYSDFREGLPRRVRLRREAPDAADLRLQLFGIELNETLPPSAFEVRIPPGVEPITLEELRRHGPLDAR
jgi:hypothetical protein